MLQTQAEKNSTVSGLEAADAARGGEGVDLQLEDSGREDLQGGERVESRAQILRVKLNRTCGRNKSCVTIR